MSCSHNRIDMAGRELVGVGVRRQEVATAKRSLEAEVGLGISDRKLEDLKPEELMNLVEALGRVYAERGDCFGLKSIGEMYELDTERRLVNSASPAAIVEQLENARGMYHEALEHFRTAQQEFQIPGFAEYLEGRIISLAQRIKNQAPWNYELRELSSAATLTEPVLAGR